MLFLFIYLFLITRLESLDYDEAILNTYEQYNLNCNFSFLYALRLFQMNVSFTVFCVCVVLTCVVHGVSRCSDSF